MHFTKYKSLIVASCLATLLTGCLGYNGIVEADKLNDEALKNSYRELSVIMDENDNQAPTYIMYVSLTGFGLRGENTVKGLPPVIVRNQHNDVSTLNGEDIPVGLLNFIFWFLPKLPPVYAYYAQDTYMKAADVNQINYQYTVKLRDALPTVYKTFVDNPFQKIRVNGVDCTATNSTCTITASDKAYDNQFNYKISLKPQNSGDAKCHSITSDITAQLQLANTVSITDISLKDAVNCKYDVSIVANKEITNDHDRLNFTYATRKLATIVR